MRLLPAYISKTFLRLFSLCVGAFVSIYLIIDFLEKIGSFSETKPKATHLVLFFLYKIPEMVVQVLPMSVLLATLLTIGLLSKSNEITAMRSSGMSIAEISRPLLIIGLGISLLCLGLNEFVLPASFDKMRYIEQILIKKKDYGTFFRRNNIWYKEDRYILQARLFDPTSKKFKGVKIWEVDDGMQPLRMMDAESMAVGQSAWVLSKVVERTFTGASLAGTSEAKEKPVPLKLKVADLKVISKYGEDMGFFQLRRYCSNLEESGYDATRYLADMHGKISYPFASAIMVFLGIPFAVSSSRSSGVARGVAQALGIGFSYFVLNAVIMSFGHSGVLPPIVSAWAANGVFMMIGVWFALKVDN